jgi:hypothetical protein
MPSPVFEHMPWIAMVCFKFVRYSNVPRILIASFGIPIADVVQYTFQLSSGPGLVFMKDPPETECERDRIPQLTYP